MLPRQTSAIRYGAGPLAEGAGSMHGRTIGSGSTWPTSQPTIEMTMAPQTAVQKPSTWKSEIEQVGQPARSASASAR